MKSLKFLSWACCLAGALTVVSCLSDDDDNNNNQSKGLSASEKALCFAAVGGDYTGKLYFYDASRERDSVDIDWYIPSDSVMTVPKFPSKALAGCISNSALKEALEAAPDQPLNCRIGFINMSPIEFLINPQTLTYNLNYSGSDHKVQVLFYVNNTYSYGTYNASSRELGMQLIIGALYIDEKQSTYMTTDVPLIFISDTKL
ncbi:MAG: DUF4840 domain-containing protein [Prevotella sp.]|nr:DUF4840 domain-containing protein [Prevotella sp.]